MSALTEQQTQVLAALAQGRTNKEIAQCVRVSDLTVRDHVSQMLRKSGARNRVELAGKKPAFQPEPDESIAARPAKSNRHALRLNAFMPVGRGESISLKLLSLEEVQQVREEASRIQPLFPSIKVAPGFFSPQSKVSFTRTPQRSTFGCGAGTNTLIINSHFTISACDLLIERDHSTTAVGRIEVLDTMWREDPVFLKWRGRQPGSEVGRITSFANVHQHGCHLAHSVYGLQD